MAIPPTPRYGIDFPATLGPYRDEEEDEALDAADEEETVGLAVAGAPTDRITRISERIEANRRHAEEVYRQRFEAGQQALMQQRMGPSVSERLAQLSAAFFAPKRMPGFAGAMDKIMPVLARQGAESREGETKRAAELRALQDQYADRGLLTEDGALQHEMALANLEQKSATARAAAERRALPRPTLGSDNRIHMVPSAEGVATPKNEAEYNALPPNTPFVFWTGPMIGEVGTKGEGGE